MGRRHRRAGTPVSLFPFLSVLSCIFGVLIMMIAIQTLAAVGDDSISRAEEYGALQKRIGELRNQTRLDMESADRGQGQLAWQQRELERVRARNREIQALYQAQKRNDRLRFQLAGLDDQLERLRKEVAKRARQRAENLAIRVLPGGTAPRRRAAFAEVRPDQVVLYEGKQQAHVIPGVLIASDTRFRAFLQAVDRNSDGLVVFLIRPGAVLTYDRAYAAATQHYNISPTKLGKVPLPGDGELDLSALVLDER